IQLAAGRGEYCGPRHWHGDAWTEASGRNPVLRLHLAGDDAAKKRIAPDPLAVEQRFLRALRNTGGDWGLSDGRGYLSFAMRREHLHPYPWAASRFSFERSGRRGIAANCDPLR